MSEGSQTEFNPQNFRPIIPRPQHQPKSIELP
jgi:hypothetical protein